MKRRSATFVDSGRPAAAIPLGGDAILWPLVHKLGSVRDLISSDGGVANHVVYSAFGEITSETDSSVDFLIGYAGRERDEESGLVNMRNRYYDPRTGRFLGEDPSGFLAGDTNLQRYVGNSPTNFTDPFGLDATGSGGGGDGGDKIGFHILDGIKLGVDNKGNPEVTIENDFGEGTITAVPEKDDNGQVIGIDLEGEGTLSDGTNTIQWNFDGETWSLSTDATIDGVNYEVAMGPNGITFKAKNEGGDGFGFEISATYADGELKWSYEVDGSFSLFGGTLGLNGSGGSDDGEFDLSSLFTNGTGLFVGGQVSSDSDFGVGLGIDLGRILVGFGSGSFPTPQGPGSVGSADVGVFISVGR